mmetsp:Transcript_31593/g.58213  ORF Transcript_31593/g.58213 Transcript_31593/m.58213 type:complete len:100 (+) Transcript_31593:1678-1977(+)
MSLLPMSMSTSTRGDIPTISSFAKKTIASQHGCGHLPRFDTDRNIPSSRVKKSASAIKLFSSAVLVAATTIGHGPYMSPINYRFSSPTQITHPKARNNR